MLTNALYYFKVTKMYEDVLKEKENLGIKLIQGEEEKKKLARENELLGRKVAENGRVCIFYMLYYHILLKTMVSLSKQHP